MSLLSRLAHTHWARAMSLARRLTPRRIHPLLDRTQVLLAELDLLSASKLPVQCDPQALHEAGEAATPFYTPGQEPAKLGLSPLLAHALVRDSTPLHGDWQIIIDQANLGDVNPMMHGGVGRGEEHDAAELLEYSFSGGQTLRVPGDWNTQHPELFWYRGVVWYRRDFQLNSAPAGRTFLYFGGANFAKAVYLNGQLLARHSGGFTPFNIEITDVLLQAGNRLIVKVDSRSHAREVPTEYNDWLNYGGITREVLLLHVPDTFIREAVVQLQAGSQTRLNARITLDGPGGYHGKLRLRIPEAGIDQPLSCDGRGIAEARFDADLTLWSPDQPHCYDVIVEAGEDRLIESIGFRSITTQGDRILLNGRDIQLKGIALHEESLRHNGRAWGKEDAQAVITQARALGANFLRLAHYPHNEQMVRACDAAGLLVWAELPVYHGIDFQHAPTLDSAKRQFQDLITRDANRAAVILWSVANETEPDSARNAYLTELVRHVRRLDPTRLLTAALLGNAHMRQVSEAVAMQLIGKLPADFHLPPIVIDDPLQDELDVLGYNEYFGWYTCAPIARELRKLGVDIDEARVREFMLEQMPNIRFTSRSSKPIVVSEFGAEAVAGLHADQTSVFSEEYQACVYRQQLAMLGASPAIRGLSPWILKDFRSPYRLHTGLQQYWNRKGLISETGQRKQAFAVLAAHYGGPAEDD